MIGVIDREFIELLLGLKETKVEKLLGVIVQVQLLTIFRGNIMSRWKLHLFKCFNSTKMQVNRVRLLKDTYLAFRKTRVSIGKTYQLI